jgi:CHAT domain-containing protein
VKPYPAPNGSYLPDKHQAYLIELLQRLEQNDFSQEKLKPFLPAIIRSFSEICPADEDLSAWCDELQQWVRWHRVQGYWLAYILQLVTLERRSIYHFLACTIYSDAQINFADDVALSSLETAYVAYRRNRKLFGEVGEPIGHILESKLRLQYTYYVTWARPFAYMDANPCADHLYSHVSSDWLVSAAREDDPDFNAADTNALSRVIDQCADDAHAFYRVLARRFLGLLHESAGRYDLAAPQYSAALDDAIRLNLSTEVGHLRRLLGLALRETGDFTGAVHQLLAANVYERLKPAPWLTSYWQALSAAELADAMLRLTGAHANTTLASSPVTAVILDHPERTLPPILGAYRDSRQLFGRHMSSQSPFPLARAAKQQLFRSYSQNALEIACCLKSQSDMLAEVELGGPREATEIVVEITAAREIAPASVPAFRRNRALYYRTLNTLPTRFEDYLANVIEYSEARRNYLESSIQFDSNGNFLMSQWVDIIAQQIVRLRIPETVFLLFHVGQGATTMLLVDLSSGVAESFSIPVGAPRLREIHEEYSTSTKDPAKHQVALDALLASYAEFLAPVLRPVLRSLSGKHLKIFPRLQMNAVPLHALQLEGKYLIDHCATVSYGQTLALFLQNHANNPSPDGTTASVPDTSYTTVRMVIGEDVPWYELLLPKLRVMYGDRLVENHQPAWDELINSITSKPSHDTVFACHGIYQPDNLEDSRLELTKHGSEGAVRFARVFAELDLQGCRSVMMGACESGLVRTEIGAEYLGLASAMLGSGVRYVIGALWTIPTVATAALVQKYLELSKDLSTSVAEALCEAQRYVMTMTRDAFAGWICEVVPPGPDLDDLLKKLATWDEHPLAHPYHWAGLQALGDV